MGFPTDLENKLYKTIQHIDLDTINRFSQEWYGEEINRYKPNISKKELIDFLPLQWFFLNQSLVNSIHWIHHITRVIIAAMFIANDLNLPLMERNSLLLAASLHDICRENDNEDVDHWKRAAERFLQNKNVFKSKEVNEKLVYDMILYHNLDEKNALSLSEESLKMIWLLKSADAIDRYRFPKKKWRYNKGEWVFVFTEDYIEFHKRLIYKSELLSLQGMVRRDCIDSIL